MLGHQQKILKKIFDEEKKILNLLAAC